MISYKIPNPPLKVMCIVFELIVKMPNSKPSLHFDRTRKEEVKYSIRMACIIWYTLLPTVFSMRCFHFPGEKTFLYVLHTYMRYITCVGVMQKGNGASKLTNGFVRKLPKSNQAAIQSFPFCYRIQSARNQTDEYRMCRGDIK